jgi:hypothetical protein
MAPITIRQTILRILAASRPFPVPAETLLGDVNRLVRPALTVEQLSAHLSWLLDRNLIGFLSADLAPDDDDARCWIIKEAGIAVLNS